MKQDTYYIMYSSPTRWSVHTKVGGHDMCIKENMTEVQAKRLKQAMISDVEDWLIRR